MVMMLTIELTVMMVKIVMIKKGPRAGGVR
jgi:hypothetical protein